MASRIEYAVSCTPICAVAAVEDVNIATETISAAVAKSLGASGSATVTWSTSTIGFASGVNEYPNITAIDYSVGAMATSLGTFTNVKFVYIKHTGYLYSSGSAVGAATTAKLKICMAATIANGTTVAILNAGDGIILPYNVACTPTLYAAGDGVKIAVELLGSA